MALGLYLHIPFCQSICSYCNFNRGLFEAGLAERYVAALATEIARAGPGAAADTIFFGGGTPSILEPPDIARLIGAARGAFFVSADAEITLETNPETVTAERMAGWREAGVNRISLGAQSFNAEELVRLERRHTAGRVGQAVREARAAGFENVSLDLMFWLPGQSRETWRRTLEQAIELDPEHLSLYLLELYPNSPLKEAMARHIGGGLETAEWAQLADDDAADMYLEAFERLDAAGLAQYEISNAARRGFESRHNLKYWSGGSWYGFGCGAHSTVRGLRWRNVASTRDYIDHIVAGRGVSEGVQELCEIERAEEVLFTGMRLTAGIDRSAFCNAFGYDPWRRYEAVLREPSQDGLVWVTDTHFGLTRQGMLVSNEIGALVIA